MKTILTFFLIAFLWINPLKAQFQFSSENLTRTEFEPQKQIVSFNQFLLQDTEFPVENEWNKPKPEGWKNPMFGALLSALLPGLGQVYAGDYVTGSIYFASEVSLWGGISYYNSKGDDKTDEFINYAEAHWHVERYYGYLIQHYVNENGGTDNFGEPDANGFFDLSSSEINFLKNYELGDCGIGCSHHVIQEALVSGKKDRNYYENIYKYFQFSQGWDDVTYPNGEPVVYANGVEVGYKQVDLQNSQSSSRATYKKMRNDANDFYKTADKISLGLFATRLVSAIHAAISINKDNKEKFATLTPDVIRYNGNLVNAATLKIRW